MRIAWRNQAPAVVTKACHSACPTLKKIGDPGWGRREMLSAVIQPCMETCPQHGFRPCWKFRPSCEESEYASSLQVELNPMLLPGQVVFFIVFPILIVEIICTAMQLRPHGNEARRQDHGEECKSNKYLLHDLFPLPRTLERKPLRLALATAFRYRRVGISTLGA